VKNAKQTFSEEIKRQDEECNYRFCVESMRIYIVQYLLPHPLSSSYLFQKRDAEGGLVTLTVEMHPLRKPPTIQRFLLSREDKAVGVLGIWHHGIEELFYGQNMQGQMLLRSLRHHHDDTIEQGLYWLCMNILLWSAS
jgi:hypothetical protein